MLTEEQKNKAILKAFDNNEYIRSVLFLLREYAGESDLSKVNVFSVTESLYKYADVNSNILLELMFLSELRK